MADKKESAKKDVRFGAGAASEIDRLIEELSGPHRRTRQEASHMLAEMAHDPSSEFKEKIEPVVAVLTDALSRSEAQTRWEALDALCKLAAAYPQLVAQAYEGAEASLFDENSSRVRISSFRLLAKLGSCTPELSDKVWPLLDEAIQCFHGDQGYRDMLLSLLELAQGDASEQTKQALLDRMKFDAESGRGYVKQHSADIVKAIEEK